MLRAIICREMGWTWSQYDEQPTFFLTYIAESMRAEGAAANKRMSQ
jgi:hypothetical protein